MKLGSVIGLILFASVAGMVHAQSSLYVVLGGINNNSGHIWVTDNPDPHACEREKILEKYRCEVDSANAVYQADASSEYRSIRDQAYSNFLRLKKKAADRRDTLICPLYGGDRNDCDSLKAACATPLSQNSDSYRAAFLTFNRAGVLTDYDYCGDGARFTPPLDSSCSPGDCSPAKTVLPILTIRSKNFEVQLGVGIDPYSVPQGYPDNRQYTPNRRDNAAWDNASNQRSKSWSNNNKHRTWDSHSRGDNLPTANTGTISRQGSSHVPDPPNNAENYDRHRH